MSERITEGDLQEALRLADALAGDDLYPDYHDVSLPRRLVAEVRRLRGLIAPMADEYNQPGPGEPCTDEVMALIQEAEAIRAEGEAATDPATPPRTRSPVPGGPE